MKKNESNILINSDKFPKELLLSILQILDDKTLARSMRVCKSWHHIIKQNHKNLLHPRAKSYIGAFFKDKEKLEKVAQLDPFMIIKQIENYRNSTFMDTFDRGTDKIGIELCKRLHLTYDPTKNRNGFLKALDFHQILLILILPFIIYAFTKAKMTTGNWSDGFRDPIFTIPNEIVLALTMLKLYWKVVKNISDHIDNDAVFKDIQLSKK